MRAIYLALLYVSIAAVHMLPAAAEEVTLKLKDGGLIVSGDLISFDGRNYSLKSDVLGEVQLSAEKFDCVGAGCPQISPPKEVPIPSDALQIAGSPLIGTELMPALIREYAQSLSASVRESGAIEGDALFEIVSQDDSLIGVIDLRRQGASAAFPALASGEAEIVMSDRSIGDAEIGLLNEAGLTQMTASGREHMIGLDGFVIYVSPENRILSLSTSDLARIFSGEIQNWSAFGLPDRKINIYAADDQSGSFRMFRSFVLSPYQRELTVDAERFSLNAELAKAVANDPGGIGFASFAEIELAKPISVTDSCGLMHEPSEFTIKSGSYPFSRNLYLYSGKLRNKLAQPLLDYAISSAAGGALREAGFIDSRIVAVHFDHFRDLVTVSLSAAKEDFNLNLLRELIGDLGQGYRLSATLRFEADSTQLDSRSIQELGRVVAYLSERDLSDKQIVLAGFSDSEGAFDRNIGLSRERASAIRDMLQNEAKGKIPSSAVQVKGYGELLPVACNDTAIGRNTNRRVEIWLTPNPPANPVASAQ